MHKQYPKLVLLATVLTTLGLAAPAQAASLSLRIPVVPESVLEPGEKVLMVGQSPEALLFAKWATEHSQSESLGSTKGAIPQDVGLPTYVVLTRQSAALDPADLAAMARKEGAALAGRGELRILPPVQESTTKERTLVEETEKGEVKQTITVMCITESHNFSFERVLVRADGEVQFEGSSIHTLWSGTICADKAGAEPTFPPREIPGIDDLHELYADGFVQTWRPFYKTREVTLPSGASLSSKSVSDLNGTLSKAKADLERSPYDHPAAVVAAVAFALAGDQEAAALLFQQAARLRGDSPVQIALHQQLLEINSELADFRSRFGLSWSKPELSAQQALLDQAAQLLETPLPTGQAYRLVSRKPVVELKTEADRKATVHGTLPVGLAVFKTEDSKRWSQITSPDGNIQGWVLTRNTTEIVATTAATETSK